ncbi:hypothetical protein CDAR_112641 [Caerostris darwini]|uniref:Uncharacterized protein n=1 Tax=Caerostris darwini TaxID=1538125 RepID=A0AAV4Q2C2_9ARAC|nr:hypothetical protein CDAR_112641 [Caerostris darwini]
MYGRQESKTDASLMKGGRRPCYLLFFVLLSGADEIGSQDADGIYTRTQSRTKRRRKELNHGAIENAQSMCHATQLFNRRFPRNQKAIVRHLIRNFDSFPSFVNGLILFFYSLKIESLFFSRSI